MRWHDLTPGSDGWDDFALDEDKECTGRVELCIPGLS